MYINTSWSVAKKSEIAFYYFIHAHVNYFIMYFSKYKK